MHVCMICKYIHILLSDYPHIDSIWGWGAALFYSSTGYDFLAEYQWGLQGGIWNNWQHVIAWRLQTYVLIFLSLSYYVVVAVYEWLCIGHASYLLAVTADLQMTQTQSLTGDADL